jgi:transposase
MALPFRLELSQEQERELEQAVKHARRAYVRMKAAAILKVKRGHSMRQVALHGLLHPVAEETVRKWINRYLTDGLAGLRVQPGRGRKPAFSPWERTH